MVLLNMNMFLNDFGIKHTDWDPTDLDEENQMIPSYKASSFISIKILRLQHEAKGKGRGFCNPGLPWWADPNCIRDPTIFPQSGPGKASAAARDFSQVGPEDRSRSTRGRSARPKSPTQKSVINANATPRDFQDLIRNLRSNIDYSKNFTEEDLVRLKSYIGHAYDAGTLNDPCDLDDQCAVDSIEEFLHGTSSLNVYYMRALYSKHSKLYELFERTVTGRRSERGPISPYFGGELRRMLDHADSTQVHSNEVLRWTNVYEWNAEAVKFNICSYNRSGSCRQGKGCGHIHA